MLETLTKEDLSSIAGWISIACWIVVYSPQIWENYKIKSGEGLSVAFIVLWLAGDLANLAGGAMAHLLPTMIILAVYYTICDLVLLFQVYYYRGINNRKQSSSETQPLLSDISTRSKSSTRKTKPLLPPYLLYPLLVVFVCGVGILAWWAQELIGQRNQGSGGPIERKPSREVELEWRSQMLGYASAGLYLGSRVPQIAHNYKTRCEGLSLAMFFFSISGNVTYVASIFFKSLDKKYLIANVSWLIGSGGTVFLDLIVLGQFIYFNCQDKDAADEDEV